MRDVVLGLTVVLADGRVIHTGGRARKSSSGCDLTRLFVGSEGTLGVITELTLRGVLPEAISAAVCGFDTMEGAVQTVITIMQLGVPVARMELLDEEQVEAVNRYSRLNYPAKPTLLFEFHGTSNAAAAEHAQMAQEIAAENGASGFQWAANPEDRSRLWQARHNTLFAAMALRPGCRGWVTDVRAARGWPIALETQRDLRTTTLVAPLVGHVGDGNFHLNIIVNPDDADELAQAKSFNERLVRRAQAMGGTCTGEHGVGIGKMEHLPAEHGAALDVMKTIKRALDPDNLMNPGKMFAL